jgi:hypothetical protein
MHGKLTTTVLCKTFIITVEKCYENIKFSSLYLLLCFIIYGFIGLRHNRNDSFPRTVSKTAVFYVSSILRHAVTQKLTSKSSINFYETTRCDIPKKL